MRIERNQPANARIRSVGGGAGAEGARRTGLEWENEKNVGGRLRHPHPSLSIQQFLTMCHYCPSPLLNSTSAPGRGKQVELFSYVRAPAELGRCMRPVLRRPHHPPGIHRRGPVSPCTGRWPRGGWNGAREDRRALRGNGGRAPVDGAPGGAWCGRRSWCGRCPTGAQGQRKKAHPPGGGQATMRKTWLAAAARSHLTSVRSSLPAGC